MNRVSLAKEVCSRIEGVSQQACDTLIKVLFEVMGDKLVEGERLCTHEFGTFYVKQQKAKNGVNPRSGEHIKIPAKKQIKFRASKLLKSRLPK